MSEDAAASPGSDATTPVERDGALTVGSSARDGALTEPLARPDASPPNAGDGAPPQAPLEASVPPPSSLGDAGTALPAWAEALPGHYAMRAQVFLEAQAFGGGLGTVDLELELALVTIERQGAGMVMRVHSCQQRSESPSAWAQVDHPELLADRVQSLVFTSEGFETVGEPIGLGYLRAVPEACRDQPGQLIDKPVHQTWISGAKCRCPSAPSERVVLEDCRVDDPDNDRQPGYSVSSGGVSEFTVHGVTESRSHFVSGRVRADRSLFARQVVDERNFQLACMPRGCIDVTELSAFCPAEEHATEFVRIEGDLSCGRILAERQRLFPTPLLTPPASCTR